MPSCATLTGALPLQSRLAFDGWDARKAAITMTNVDYPRGVEEVIRNFEPL